jgi:hypothetical protein
MANKAAVDRLDDPAGSEVVAEAVANGPEGVRAQSQRSVFSRGSVHPGAASAAEELLQ